MGSNVNEVSRPREAQMAVSDKKSRQAKPKKQQEHKSRRRCLTIVVVGEM